MTSLIKRLKGKSTKHEMEYKEKSLPNAPAVAWNAVVSMASKFEDNILWVMTTPVIASQLAI